MYDFRPREDSAVKTHSEYCLPHSPNRPYNAQLYTTLLTVTFLEKKKTGCTNSSPTERSGKVSFSFSYVFFFFYRERFMKTPSQTLTIGKEKTETDIHTNAHAHTHLSEQAKVVHRTMELVSRQK